MAMKVELEKAMQGLFECIQNQNGKRWYELSAPDCKVYETEGNVFLDMADYKDAAECGAAVTEKFSTMGITLEYVEPRQVTHGGPLTVTEQHGVKVWKMPRGEAPIANVTVAVTVQFNDELKLVKWTEKVVLPKADQAKPSEGRCTLRRVGIKDLQGLLKRTENAVDAVTLSQAKEIVEDVQTKGLAGLVSHAVRLRDLEDAEQPVVVSLGELKAAYDSIPINHRQALERMAARIKAFATAQRNSLTDTTVKIRGGTAGHRVEAVATAGCYAPGGRYPLPSSVLMTAITARVAGVKCVWVASPRPATATLAAAHIAGVDGFLRVGGAQAIAAMAFGVGPVPPADVIVGPGNRWVTAAKQLVSGRVGIDMLAGPSECLVLADDSSSPKTIAADLLAQAEHDTDARPILVAIGADGAGEALVSRVDAELERQLATLPTAVTARQAVSRAGFAVVVPSLPAGLKVVDAIAPEHLEVLTRNAEAVSTQLRNYGGLFIGSQSAEVMGDYGAGPNHVLPTGGTGRYTGGLSVFTFLAIRTWMLLDAADTEGMREVTSDAVTVARIEGLEGHARAAELRMPVEIARAHEEDTASLKTMHSKLAALEAKVATRRAQ